MKLLNLYNKIPNWVMFVVQVVILGIIFQILVDNLGSWGIWGFFAFIIIYSCIMLFRKRDNYMTVMRTIETRIWGRPLDKQYGRPPKVIIGKKDD